MLLKVRDRKVVRAASRCMGSTTGMDRHAPVVQAPSYSPPRCRPITSDGAFGAKTGSILLTVSMLRKTFSYQTATMYERSACVVHVYEVSAHSSAAHAYSKRRGGSPCHRRLREVPSGCVPGHRVRVERRARVLAGRRSFVSIHTRSVVAREPRGTRVGSTFTMLSITAAAY